MSEGHCEARVDHRRENAKGVFITFLVHPDEVSKLDGLRAGSTVVLGWAETVNANVEKIEIQGGCSTADALVAQGQKSLDHTSQSRDSGPTPDERTKPRRSFKDMPLSQQCGMLCEDAQFAEFIASRRGGMPPDNLPKYVRGLCLVQSRAELDSSAERAELWRNLIEEFRQWQTDKKYADVLR